MIRSNPNIQLVYFFPSFKCQLHWTYTLTLFIMLMFRWWLSEAIMYLNHSWLNMKGLFDNQSHDTKCYVIKTKKRTNLPLIFFSDIKYHNYNKNCLKRVIIKVNEQIKRIIWVNSTSNFTVFIKRCDFRNYILFFLKTNL